MRENYEKSGFFFFQNWRNRIFSMLLGVPGIESVAELSVINMHFFMAIHNYFINTYNFFRGRMLSTRKIWSVLLTFSKAYH